MLNVALQVNLYLLLWVDVDHWDQQSYLLTRQLGTVALSMVFLAFSSLHPSQCSCCWQGETADTSLPLWIMRGTGDATLTKGHRGQQFDPLSHKYFEALNKIISSIQHLSFPWICWRRNENNSPELGGGLKNHIIVISIYFWVNNHRISRLFWTVIPPSCPGGLVCECMCSLIEWVDVEQSKSAKKVEKC